tara:strand:- start:1170 stop:2132 length:963 start_codon:yes stop_codon:yes gene_type:complete
MEKEQESEIQILSRKIAKTPEDIDLLYSRVNYNKSKKNLESALFDLKEIVRLDSLSTIHHHNIAEVYFELAKSKQPDPRYVELVRHHLERSINIDAQNKDALALMGELLLAYNKYEEAIESFNASLRIEYNQANTHMLMGYAFKQLKRDDNAIDCFRNSVNIDPSFLEAHIQLGQIFHMSGDTTALVYYNNALRLDPTNEIVLYNKALFYQNVSEWNNALDAYSVLHKANPFHSSGHYNLGFIHMELGLYDVATNNFSDAIYSDSEFYEAYYSRGSCFETLGNIAQAESDYKRAISINPGYIYAIEALESLIDKNKKYNK